MLRKTTSRLTAILVTLCLALTVMPLTAIAVEGGPAPTESTEADVSTADNLDTGEEVDDTATPGDLDPDDTSGENPVTAPAAATSGVAPGEPGGETDTATPTDADEATPGDYEEQPEPEQPATPTNAAPATQAVEVEAFAGEGETGSYAVDNFTAFADALFNSPYNNIEIVIGKDIEIGNFFLPPNKNVTIKSAPGGLFTLTRYGDDDLIVIDDDTSALTLENIIISDWNQASDNALVHFSGGALTFRGNVQIENSKGQNVLVDEGKYVTLENPGADMRVGVTKDTDNGVFVESAKDGDNKYFFADDEDKTILIEGRNLRIADAAEAQTGYTLYYEPKDGKLYKRNAYNNIIGVYDGDGYKGSGNTLTLKDFSFTSQHSSALTLPSDVTLELEGNNSINTTYVQNVSRPIAGVGALQATNLTIRGSGSLTVTAADGTLAAVLDAENFTVESGSLIVNPGGGDVSSVGILVLGMLTHNGGTIEAKGTASALTMYTTPEVIQEDVSCSVDIDGELTDIGRLSKPNPEYRYQAAGGVFAKNLRIAKKYSVVYELGGGTGTAPATVRHEVGTKVKLAGTSEITPPAGMQLKEWNTAQNGKGDVYTPGSTIDMPANRLTLYAIWENETHTVTFVENGGSEVKDITDVALDAKITAPTSPTRVGYTFGGWYKENTLKTPWDFANDTVTSDITLYAKWTQNAPLETYTVTFEENGGTPVTNITGVTSGDKITAPTHPTRAGYSFGGWYKENTLATLWDFATDTVTSNITLYAKWTENPPPTYSYDSDDDGSSGGGRGSSSTSTTPTGPVTVTSAVATTSVNAAIAAARASGADTATARLINPGDISLATLQAMARQAGNMPLKVNADSMNGNAVDVRISFDPALATTALNLSASTVNAAARRTTEFFERFFQNDVMTVALGQQGSFGMPVEIAAKLNPTLDVNNLTFYAYDPRTNRYTRIENPEYWVDANGYVHFTTEYAGEIIISEGELERK